MNRTLYRILARSVLHPFFRLSRGLTLGTRTLVRNADGKVLLVRHTYAPGWMFPGGGVERGEVAEDSATREVYEEAGIRLEEPLRLFGLYSNNTKFPGDHVALYLAETGAEAEARPQLEIAECGFFATDALPPETTEGTRRRIAEVLDGRRPAAHW